MKERPILLSGPMIRATLAGTKTQTRRIIPFRDPDAALFHGFRAEDGAAVFGHSIPDDPVPVYFAPKYGVPGDRLWVKETWGYRGESWSNDRPDVRSYLIHYQADDAKREFVFPASWDEHGLPRAPKQRPDQPYEDFYGNTLTRYWRSWRPSIFMPRWASRITLDVAEVRVERLQDISHEDVLAEGVTAEDVCAATHVKFSGTVREHYRKGFQALWDSINEQRAPWKSNPWVWAISFKRIESAREAA